MIRPVEILLNLCGRAAHFRPKIEARNSAFGQVCQDAVLNGVLLIRNAGRQKGFIRRHLMRSRNKQERNPVFRQKP